MIDYNALFLATLRLECKFSDDIGNFSSVSGTCFAIHIDDTFVLVTNRHMVDPSFINEKSTQKLSDMYLWCRRISSSNTDAPSEKFKIGLSNIKIVSHSSADAALIMGVQLFNSGDIPIINPILKSSLASEEFFLNELGIADPCVFIGYPSNNSLSPWWDTSLGLPIVRLANIASYPQQDFINGGVKSSHARLVTGLSFAGSSGSPILNMGSNFKTKTGFVNLPDAIVPKIIGIMAGHWWDDNKQIPEMLKHTGLSYFVTSSAILELLE